MFPDNNTPKDAVLQEDSTIKSILVIDDILYILKSITNVLKGEGYVVLNAMNGAETLELLKKNLPDLITIDQKLPDTTGLKLAREIRKLPLLKKPKIIFISANYDKEEIQNILQNEDISNYLIKPFKKDKLIEVVKELIGEPRF
jgi:CheY-like chemotaxis protein